MNVREFDTLFNEHGRLVWSIIRNFGIPDADAGDVFMEVWEGVFRSFPSYGGRARVSTWIGGVSRHKCADYMRRIARNPIAGAQEIEFAGEIPHVAGTRHVASSASRSPAGRAMRREAMELVERALVELPPRQRRIVQLWMEGKKYRTIAEIMNLAGFGPIDDNYVGKQIYRAKARLREMFKVAGLTSSGDMVE